MIFTINELMHAIIMTLAVGFIFKDIFKTRQYGFDWEAFGFAILVTAPAILLHELGHKIIAIMYGFQATFHAAIGWLGIGVVLRLLGSPFIFFVPAYVQITGAQAMPLQYSMIAFAGPLVNLILFAVAVLLLRQKKLSKKTYMFLTITKKINLFLFIFNMLPIPGFDGFKVFQGIFQYLF